MRQILIVCLSLSYLLLIAMGPIDTSAMEREDHALKDKTQKHPAYLALIENLTQAGSKQDSFSILMDLGETALAGEFDSKKVSFTYYKKAYDLGQSIGTPEVVASSTLAMAKIYRRTDQYDSLYQYCLRAIDIGQRYQDINPTWLASGYYQKLSITTSKVNTINKYL